MSKVPPTFSDLAKASNDLLGKDFPVGAAKLEVHTTTSNGIKFSVTGNKDNKSGSIGSDLKVKYTDKPRGLAVTETWTTANALSAQVEFTDSIAKGVKLDLNGSLTPNHGQHVKAGVEYKQDYAVVRTALDLFKGPTLAGDAVVGSDGWLAGAEVSYDLADARLTRYQFALGYSVPEYTASLHANNQFSTFTAAYFHRVNGDIEAGGRATWNKTSEKVHIEVGTKYNLDRTTFLKAKIDNNGRLGLGYTQSLRPGVKLSLGGLFDTTRLSENTHKVGLSLVLES
ncbi:eukaryotic porin/Tom40 [Cladochytrium replicatum]|nr:eukaryotic porin/Tom40 [Cladochytrium replicatum]